MPSVDEAAELTRDGVKRFQAWYGRSRQINTPILGLASSSMRSLRRVYEDMGMPVPPWALLSMRGRFYVLVYLELGPLSPAITKGAQK